MAELLKHRINLLRHLRHNLTDFSEKDLINLPGYNNIWYNVKECSKVNKVNKEEIGDKYR